MSEAAADSLSGPYLTAALFCERVLEEKDGIKSLIRVVDRLVIQAHGPGAPEAMPQIKRELVGVLMFKSGEARGPVPIRLALTEPSGLARSEDAWRGTIYFEGGTRGHAVTLRMNMTFEAPGAYWFNVYIGDRLTTRMPYEVIYTTSAMGTGPGQTPQP